MRQTNTTQGRDICDILGRDIFAIERELETAQLETDYVIAQLWGQA